MPTRTAPDPIPTPHRPAPDQAAWQELGRAAVRLCDADTGGTAPGDAVPGERPALLRLARRLSRAGRCATIDDPDSGSHLAAAPLAAEPGTAAMLWIERRTAPFDRRALAQLRWLASEGGALLHVVDEDRRQTELLLQESRHRCANDLHLVGSLLSHRARFAEDRRVRDALESVAGRVMMLAQARREPGGDLVSALQGCVDALARQVGERGIAVSLRVEGEALPIDERRAAVLLIAANELATNAIKHAFAPGHPGRVAVALRATPDAFLLTVEDDGAPMPGGDAPLRARSGLDLVGRLVAGIRATLTAPPAGSKRFTIELPVARATHQGRTR